MDNFVVLQEGHMLRQRKALPPMAQRNQLRFMYLTRIEYARMKCAKREWNVSSIPVWQGFSGVMVMVTIQCRCPMYQNVGRNKSHIYVQRFLFKSSFARVLFGINPDGKRAILVCWCCCFIFCKFWTFAAFARSVMIGNPIDPWSFITWKTKGMQVN